jgi:subtilisin family serine protease
MPWEDNLAWDDAIAEDPDIAIGGHRENEFLYRPRQLVCDKTVWEAPRDERERGIRGRLGDADARSLTEQPQSDDEVRRGQAADRLDLHLLDVPRGDVVRLADDGREQARVPLDLVHVVTANPQRHGGHGKPQPIPEPPAFTFTTAAPANAGQGKTIAVLDTGITGSASRPFPVQGPAPADVEPVGVTGEATGHGTMVAGVIAQFAPGATLVIRRVLSVPLGVADEIDIAHALDALPAVDIVNASFGGRAVADATMVTFKRAVDRVPDGTVIVSSAGNEGENRPHFMAAFKRVIGVASVKEAQSGVWELEDYSNRGWWCDACTTGTDVVSVDLDGKGFLCSGTSFAAPKLCAKIAVLASANPGMSVLDAAKQIVEDPANPLVAGAGRLF